MEMELHRARLDKAVDNMGTCASASRRTRQASDPAVDNPSAVHNRIDSACMCAQSVDAGDAPVESRRGSANVASSCWQIREIRLSPGFHAPTAFNILFNSNL
ncbi:hypothetical protein GCM10009106_23280 [Sphingomonas japonica]